MCTREDLLRLSLQEGCWYNLRSRKALEDSKGRTTKSPLATNKTAAWSLARGMRGSSSGGAGAASLTRLSCDADETRKGWAA